MSSEIHQQSVYQDMTIVDADAHVTEDVADIIPYMDDGPIHHRIKNTTNFKSDILSMSAPAPASLTYYGSETDTENKAIASDDEDGDTHLPGADGETMLGHMQEFNIDYAILSPSTFLGINTINNPRFSVPLASAYNDWVIDRFLDIDTSFRSTILVAADKPDLASEEIDTHAAEDGFVGVALATAGLKPPLGHERYDPIYQAAQDHELPITLHGVSSGMIKTFPSIYEWAETKAESIFYGHHLTNIWNIVSAMARGLPARYPDLDIVFQESGISHVPYLKWQLDDLYMEFSEEFPYLDQLPSEYFDDNFYFTTQPIGMTAKDRSQLATAIELAGVESIMYAADFPHPTFDPPAELYNRLNGQLGDEQERAIMGTRALEVFGV